MLGVCNKDQSILQKNCKLYDVLVFVLALTIDIGATIESLRLNFCFLMGKNYHKPLPKLKAQRRSARL
jgi:hypothetical protein